MSHAYIFEGENAALVRKHASDFAKGLNCASVNTDNTENTHNVNYANSGAGSPCRECLSCRVFDSGNHPDTVFVTGTKQSGIGVEDVREQILLPMAVKPFKYQFKVFIVDLLSKNILTHAAQNALLKTIEEPAPYGVFLFLAANTHGFLPTMLSRCAIKKIRAPGGGEYFYERAAKPEKSPTYENEKKEEKGKGKSGKAGKTSKTAEPDLHLPTLANEIIAGLHGADITQAFAMYRRVESLNKDALHELLDLMYIIYGETISAAAGIGQSPLPAWFDAVAAITHTKNILAQNGNTQLAIELMFMKLSGVLQEFMKLSGVLQSL